VMSISDAMMWRYFELLTDVQLPEIETMKRESHPMEAKKDLARRIVTDFHSAEAATKAAEDWAKQFQKDEVPTNVEEVEIPLGAVWGASDKEAIWDVVSEGTSLPDCRMKLDKLIALASLADSISDAVRKLKQKAVKVDGEIKTDPIIFWNPRNDMTLRVGKKIKKIHFDLRPDHGN
jgi:tyrosyl-tRNA synthetase